MKLKTKKFISKRVRIKKSGKMIKKTAGQAHFNSSERGNTTRNKRSNSTIDPTSKVHKNIKKLIPYHY